MPVRALETNEIEVFDININRVKCALAPAPAKYWIMKQTDPDDANGFIFYAASYEASKEMFNRSLNGSVTSIAGKIV